MIIFRYEEFWNRERIQWLREYPIFENATLEEKEVFLKRAQLEIGCKCGLKPLWTRLRNVKCWKKIHYPQRLGRTATGRVKQRKSSGRRMRT